MRPPQFTIRDLLWLTITVAFVVCIVLERRPRPDTKIILQARREDIEYLRWNRDVFADLEIVYSTILTNSQEREIQEHFESRQDGIP